MTRIVLTVPGKPRGKGRPKFARRGNFVSAYTDDQTMSAEESIRAAWKDAGAVRLDDGPLALDVTLTHERPKGHFRKDGELTTEGARHPVPTRKPDADNCAKLVMDALNGLAYRDDAQIADLHVSSAWGLRAQTRIEVGPLRTLAVVVLAKSWPGV